MCGVDKELLLEILYPSFFAKCFDSFVSETIPRLHSAALVNQPSPVVSCLLPIAPRSLTATSENVVHEPSSSSHCGRIEHCSHSLKGRHATSAVRL
jgi:hypothetical protein